MGSPAKTPLQGLSSRRIVHFRNLGDSLGLSAGSTPELIREVMRGFSYRALEHIETNSGLPLQTLAEILGIPERTLARRKVAGRMAPGESEKLLRLASVFEKAVELFEGDVSSAVNWMRAPKRALAGHTPLDFARTEVGAKEVENLIGRLEHGVFS